MGDILEVLMLICFASSWPISILNSLKTKTSKGKSLVFSLLILFGYVFGTIAKLVKHDIVPYVMAVYILTILLILVDVFLYFKYKKFDNQKDFQNN